MKTYTNKNGEVKEYNQTEYNKRYYEKNKEQILQNKYTCEFCNKQVSKSNRTNHEKTVKHQLHVRLPRFDNTDN